MMTAWITGSEEVVPTHAPTLPEDLPHLLQLHHHASHEFCWRVGDAWLGLVAARAKRNGPGRVMAVVSFTVWVSPADFHAVKRRTGTPTRQSRKTSMARVALFSGNSLDL